MKIAYGAGHRLVTAGKRCLKSIDPSETREWVLNDRVARAFAAAAGRYEGVELLRVDDPAGVAAIDLTQRVKAANEWGADFCLAIHHNSGINGGAGGGIVAYVGPLVDQTTTDYQRSVYEACVAATGLCGNRSTPLATGNLYVCNATIAPCVLMECGFMDSTHDTPIILTEEYSSKMGYAMMDGIAKVAGLSKKSEGYKVRVTEQRVIYAKAGLIEKGVYTVTEELGGMGRLKSGVGWICLDYTEKL